MFQYKNKIVNPLLATITTDNPPNAILHHSYTRPNEEQEKLSFSPYYLDFCNLLGCFSTRGSSIIVPLVYWKTDLLADKGTSYIITGRCNPYWCAPLHTDFYNSFQIPIIILNHGLYLWYCLSTIYFHSYPSTAILSFNRMFDLCNRGEIFANWACAAFEFSCPHKHCTNAHIKNLRFLWQ